MRDFDYVIVGGGLAASAAVDGIREADPTGSIGILTDEQDPPYHRPPLSKEFLQTENAPRELLHVKPARWFANDPNLALFTDTRVERLDARAMTVCTAGGGAVRGRRILVATGGRARAIPVPGSDLAGVTTLRSVEDSERLRLAAQRAESVVSVGAGFIGMEVASTLSKAGLNVTVAEVEKRVWSGVFPEAMSHFLQRHFEERGVRILLGSGVSKFVDAPEFGAYRQAQRASATGLPDAPGARRSPPRPPVDGEDAEESGKLSRVILDNGEDIRADVAVVGIGMAPNDELAAEAGLAVRDGIVVDACCETTAPHIYAAGDVARYPDPRTGRIERTEHWDHAKAHGRQAGRNMAGADEPYDHLSYFFTNVFDLGINVIGRTANAESAVVSGELGAGRSIVYCVEDDRLAGTILINAAGAMEDCRRLVARRPTVKELLSEFENARPQVGEGRQAVFLGS